MRLKPWLLGLVVCTTWSCSDPVVTDESFRQERPGQDRAVAARDRAGPDQSDRQRDRDRRADREQHRDRDRKPDATPARRTFTVTHVVDGDTLDLGNGERVRLVGIDTPEEGECGYEPASGALADLVLGRRVSLAASDEDRDGYGRLLRYVDVGRTDAGLTLIRRGLAIARYDSRDGYGFHPREPRYLAADRGTRPVCHQPRPLAAVPPPAPAQAGCAAGYSPCVPAYPPDVDCAGLDGPIRVDGRDPHGLDADGDGTGCD